MGGGQSAPIAGGNAKLTDEERKSVDTSNWHKYGKEAEELSNQLKNQVNDALKQSAQIQISNYCKPERGALLECYKANQQDPLKCWDLAQQFKTCTTNERMKA